MERPANVVIEPSMRGLEDHPGRMGPIDSTMGTNKDGEAAPQSHRVSSGRQPRGREQSLS